MIAKTPHPHAKILAEAIQDINRKILGKRILADFLEEVTLSVVAGSDLQWEFHFADTLQPKVVSSLTDRELCRILDEHNRSLEDINFSVIRAVANAAAAKHDADVAKKTPPLKGPLYEPVNFNDHDLISPEERQALYKNSGLKFKIF